MLLYPWADTHSDVSGVSPVTGTNYGHAPPDFYFYDVGSLRLGDYMGDYGGDLDEDNIGTINEIIWYSVQGGMLRGRLDGPVLVSSGTPAGSVSRVAVLEVSISYFLWRSASRSMSFLNARFM